MDKPRRYLRSHPFLSFQVAFGGADPTLWMLLGEARSKCDHIAQTPVLPGVRAELDKLYLAKGLKATTAIEGNTLSEEDVRKRLEGELALPPSQEYLGQEVDNIHRALGRIPELIGQCGPGRMTPEIVCEHNRLVLEGLDVPASVVPGEIRRHEVTVNRYSAAPAEDCAFLVARLCEWLNSPGDWPQGLDAISEALLKAILAHLYLAWIHPFGDGNGRTARLIEVHLLAGAGVNRSVAHLLSNHYNQTRAKYYEQLARAAVDPSGPTGFVRYALQGLVDGMKEQLAWIRAQVQWLTWRDLVYSTFGHAHGKVSRRRREVALALIGTVAASAEEVRHLSRELAEMYSGMHARTVARDLAYLEGQRLVVRTGDGEWRANLDLLQNLLPARAVER